MQLKNYNLLLDTSPNLYVTLRQEIPTQRINPENNAD